MLEIRSEYPGSDFTEGTESNKVFEATSKPSFEANTGVFPVKLTEKEAPGSSPTKLSSPLIVEFEIVLLEISSAPVKVTPSAIP